MNEWMSLSTTADDVVVSSQDCQTVPPTGQPRVLDVTDLIRRIKNVREEYVTARGEIGAEPLDHPFQPCLEISNPRQRLVQRGSVHRFFSRRSAPVIMNEVVPSGCHDNQGNLI